MPLVYRSVEASTFVNAYQGNRSPKGQGQPFLDCPMHGRISSISLKASAHTSHCNNQKTPSNFQSTLLGVTAPSFSPHQAAQAPEVTYEADKGSTWTLLLTNLGGYLGCTGLLCLPHLPGARALGSWGRGQVEISSSFRRSGERWQSPQSAGLFVCRWTPAGAGCRVCPLAGVSTWGGAAGQAYREALASWEGLPLNFSLRPTVD